MKWKQGNMQEPATVNRLFLDYLSFEASLKMNSTSLEYQEVLISHRTINNPSSTAVRSTFKVQSSQ